MANGIKGRFYDDLFLSATMARNSLLVIQLRQHYLYDNLRHRVCFVLAAGGTLKK